MPADAATVQRIQQELAAPFDASEVKFKPAVVSGNRALALAYVDARVIQDRLDRVFGVAGWQDDYESLADGSVLCRLKCRIGDEWIVKVDVGGQSEQPDEGDRHKAAFSDALKRVAVKFGIGRYLYRLPSQWVDYDPKKKQFVGKPTSPAPTTAPPKLAQQTAVAPPAKSRPINQQEQAQLAGLLEQKGVAMSEAMGTLSLPANTPLGSLTVQQSTSLVRRLKAMADAGDAAETPARMNGASP